MLPHDLWLECAVPVSWHIKLHVPGRCRDCLAAVIIAAVCSAFPAMLVFPIPEMIIKLSFEHILQHRREHLLKGIPDVLRAFVVEFINQF